MPRAVSGTILESESVLIDRARISPDEWEDPMVSKTGLIVGAILALVGGLGLFLYLAVGIPGPSVGNQVRFVWGFITGIASGAGVALCLLYVLGRGSIPPQ